MAFQLVQKFEKVDYSYDPQGDVLDVSFGRPAPAVALQVEDWLALRVGLQPPNLLQGITVVGFKRIFEKLNRYIETELPERMERLSRAEIDVSYDDGTDTLIIRVRERVAGRSRTSKRRSSDARRGVSIFEPLSPGAVTGSVSESEKALRNVYVEKSLPSKELVGVKILEYTKCGPAAFGAIFGALIDTLFFEPHLQDDENVRLVTHALMQHVDWRHLAHLAA
jgi:hypothetical protein